MSPQPYDPNFKPPHEEDEASSVSTDFESLSSPAPAPEIASSSEAGNHKKSREISTDFLSLTERDRQQQKRTEKLGLTDWFVEGLTPILIFLMVYAFVYFLLNIRYVYTEVHDREMRIAVISFIVGIVALNRVVAREGSQESFLYIFGLGMAVGLFTLSLGAFDVGSVARGFMNDNVWLATGFNVGLVGVLWWAVNRLTHECCVDENRTAGDIGILTGTARRLQKQIQKEDTQVTPPKQSWFKKKTEAPLFPGMDLQAYDPSEANQPKQVLAPKPVKDFSDRLQKRHPGISIFYFSVPVMVVFVLGLPVVRHGGDAMILSGHFYMGLYTICALMLLMLTSLGGLRAYFRQRHVTIPAGIGLFWVGLGLVMIVIVVVGALRIPKPALPDLAFVGEHQTDFWTRGSTFTLTEIVVTPMQVAEQSQLLDKIGTAVLGLIGLFVLYGVAKGLVAIAGTIGRRRDRYPEIVVKFFNLLEKVLSRLTKLPVKRPRHRVRRVQRDIATCTAYNNPLSPGPGEPALNTNQQIEYAYQALCALAYDLGVPRADDQTPYEFLQSFPPELKGLKSEAQELTQLYVVAAYSPLSIDDSIHDRLRKFWLSYTRIRNKALR